MVPGSRGVPGARRLSRFAAALGVVVVATLGDAIPAFAGSGVDGVPVPIATPRAVDLNYSWGLPPGSVPTVPAGAPSVRISFPQEVRATDVDPTGLTVRAGAAGDPSCPSTTTGMRLEGWDLVVDLPAVSAALGPCLSNGWYGFDLEGKGAVDTIHLGVTFEAVPGTSATEVDLVLTNGGFVGGTRSYVTPPAHAAPGVTIDIMAEPRFFDSYPSALHVELLEGSQLVDVAASAVVTGLSSGLAITLPADMPPTATSVRVRSYPWGGYNEDVVVPFGSPVPDVVDGYVTSVYEDLFGREPEGAGLAGWAASLRSGTPYSAVADAITSSAEFRSTLIATVYQDVLHRSPEPGGLASWLSAMNAGMRIQDMDAGILASPECYATSGGSAASWVAWLYQVVLDRAPTDSEVGGWSAVLGRGVSRFDVAKGFVYSTEGLSRVVDGYYVHNLHRRADAGGVAGWVHAIQDGMRSEQIVAGIVGSAEYRQNVPRA